MQFKLSSDDAFDNDLGIVVLALGPESNLLQLPDYTFTLGSIKFKARTQGGSIDITLVQSGLVQTLVGLSGFNLVDSYGFASTYVTVPPTATPTPLPEEG